MSLLRRKAPEDRANAARQLVISYKKFFNSHEGKEVFSDLCNRFGLLDDAPLNLDGVGLARHVGAQSVMKYILKQAHIDMAQFEAMLDGKL